MNVQELSYEELEQVVGGGWVIAGTVSSTAITEVKNQVVARPRPIQM